eukprot:TRINITY_DN1656_c0_g1_i4.p1 TRINITY_DN1656_c0_g1~~TRINITY_DN1656_c0_g1_i4.p1  ORF type:complete len:118 (-),score=0.25 TRINITY_DN1656_c0_g1_i4:184-537(-)
MVYVSLPPWGVRIQRKHLLSLVVNVLSLIKPPHKNTRNDQFSSDDVPSQRAEPMKVTLQSWRSWASMRRSPRRLDRRDCIRAVSVPVGTAMVFKAIRPPSSPMLAHTEPTASWKLSS